MWSVKISTNGVFTLQSKARVTHSLSLTGISDRIFNNEFNNYVNIIFPSNLLRDCNIKFIYLHVFLSHKHGKAKAFVSLSSTYGHWASLSLSSLLLSTVTELHAVSL